MVANVAMKRGNEPMTVPNGSISCPTVQK